MPDIYFYEAFEEERLALIRCLPKSIRAECLGKNLLVAGVGHIGKQIADIGLALGMNVLAVDPVEKHPNLHYLSFSDALPQADLIVCSMNLTVTNADFFTYERLAGAKPGALFINIARGELAPPSDLLRLLREGILGGIGLDVYPEEQELAVRLRTQQGFGDTPSMRALAELRKEDRVILTPHNAFNTREAVDRKASQSIEQLHHFLQHEHFLWPIPE
ncbi:MAG: NAD(P)-dependent oxidoreductase [Kiritimatiellae bacterium]|nr:NAD(P)-dependent oxidoreductase [Kiritimatiellia bacterium]